MNQIEVNDFTRIFIKLKLKYLKKKNVLGGGGNKPGHKSQFKKPTLFSY